MPNKCIVFGCGNVSSKYVKLHQFPTDEPALSQWITFIRKDKPSFSPSASSVVCSLHFATECFRPTGFLIPGSIPKYTKCTSALNTGQFWTASSIAGTSGNMAPISGIVPMAMPSSMPVSRTINSVTKSAQSGTHANQASIFKCIFKSSIYTYNTLMTQTQSQFSVQTAAV